MNRPQITINNFSLINRLHVMTLFLYLVNEILTQINFVESRLSSLSDL